MITDQQTNFLYLSDLLPVRFPTFFQEFEARLNKTGILFSLLPGTKDIWAVDYMPVQVEKDQFIQFKYYPDYLRNSENGRYTITNPHTICEALQVSVTASDLVADGGNVIRCTDKVILCDKICKENPSLTSNQIRQKLENLFEVHQVFFIPTDPSDPVGHADGMVRFVDEHTVLINDYDECDAELKSQLQRVMKQAGFEMIPLTYNPYNNKGRWDASGIYINYLHMEQGIVLPVFNCKDDEAAVRLLEGIFIDQPVTTVHSSVLAREGGILNCVSWNIVQ